MCHVAIVKSTLEYYRMRKVFREIMARVQAWVLVHIMRLGDGDAAPEYFKMEVSCEKLSGIKVRQRDGIHEATE